MKNTWRTFPTFRVNDTKDVTCTDFVRSAGAKPFDNDEKVCGKEQQQRPEDEYASNAKAKSVLASLTDDELEIAARTYYDYIVDRQHSSSIATGDVVDEDINKNERRTKFATALANRYIHWYKDESIETIVKNLKDNIQFRVQHEIDQLRLAHTNTTSPDYTTLRNYIGQKKVYVSGYDNYGRSTYYFIPRNVQCHDKQYTRKVHLWTIERAIACSKHNDKTINAIVDFNGFNTNQHSPPLAIGKDLLSTLSYHYYSNHIHNVFLIDAPVPFMYMWTMVFKHFINKRTASKIHFINRSTSKNKSSVSTTSIQSSQQIDMNDEQQESNKALYHSFETSTQPTVINLQQHQPKEKETFLPLISSKIPFLSSAMHATYATNPSTILSSYTTTTGLLRAGGDGIDNNKIPTPSSSSSIGSSWKSRLLTFGKKLQEPYQEQQQSKQQRRNKRTKSTATSVYATMNNNDLTTNDCNSITMTDTTSTVTVDAPTTSEPCETTTSNIQSDSILHQLYSSDQLPSWILPTGTKNRELDVEEYLDVIPFNRAFDE
jgi:CRAL/TRIO domain